MFVNAFLFNEMMVSLSVGTNCGMLLSGDFFVES